MRMTKQRKAIIERMQKGVNIIREKTDFGGHVYAMSDGGDVSQGVVEGLLANDALMPLGDGLFGDSQSYRLAEAVSCGA